MSVYIPEDTRKFVAERANYLCEYCLIHESTVFLDHQIEHIISLKHSGSSDSENLAYACVFCNRNKGSDVGSFLFSENDFVRFFNPRIENWTDHFELQDAFIKPISLVGRATEKILSFNDLTRFREREMLMKGGKYPTAEALKFLNKK